MYNNAYVQQIVMKTTLYIIIAKHNNFSDTFYNMFLSFKTSNNKIHQKTLNI